VQNIRRRLLDIIYDTKDQNKAVAEKNFGGNPGTYDKFVNQFQTSKPVMDDGDQQTERISEQRHQNGILRYTAELYQRNGQKLNEHDHNIDDQIDKKLVQRAVLKDIHESEKRARKDNKYRKKSVIRKQRGSSREQQQRKTQKKQKKYNNC